MPTVNPTRVWLDSRTDAQLEALLEYRPDLTLGAPVADLDDLAQRMDHPMSVSSVLIGLPRPAVEVLDALSALDGGATLERVTGLLDNGGRDADVHVRAVLHWLHVLEQVGLAWEQDDRLVVNPGVHRVIVTPLKMGPPARALAEGLTVDGLKRLYTGLQVPAPARRAELLAGIPELYADPARVRRAVGRAPEQVVELLTQRAAGVARTSMTGTPFAEGPASTQERYQQRQTMNRWAVEQGIGFGDGYGFGLGYYHVTFPAEVLLALAPPSYQAPFHPEPPALPTAEISEEQTERDSAAAVSGTLAAVMAALESTLRAPVRLLKNGGVGARELTRLAKSVGVESAEVRLALELGASLRFYRRGWQDPQIQAGTVFETWRQQPPVERAADLLLTWWDELAPPTRERDDDDKVIPALSSTGGGPGGPPNQVLLVLLHSLDGAAVVGLEPVLERLRWSHPLMHHSEPDLRSSWAEAARFGVVRDGRLTRLGQALLTGEREAVVTVLQEALPEESGEVLFGSDLTVVVPGSPGAAVVDLLDALAARESHGVGATWRISDASVREALDRGYTADNLLAELRQVSGRALPQPVEYLIRDVERRHGRMGVQPAGCVIVSEDQGLLAEVAATRGLRSLELVQVAPTVLAGAADPTTTVAALRKTGYLPVEHDSTGARAVQLRSHGPIGEREPSQAEPDLAPEHADEAGDPGDDASVDLADEDFDAALERELADLGLLPPTMPPAHAPQRREEPAELVARLRAGGSPPGMEP